MDAEKKVYGRSFFDDAYGKWNRFEFIHPDPLEFVWKYKDKKDMEAAGLIAACLAYGNVKQILKSVEKALAPLGAHPAARLKDM